jgi:hypothetical protein
MTTFIAVLIYIGFFACIGALLVLASRAIWYNFALPAKVWASIKAKFSKLKP